MINDDLKLVDEFEILRQLGLTHHLCMECGAQYKYFHGTLNCNNFSNMCDELHSLIYCENCVIKKRMLYNLTERY